MALPARGLPLALALTYDSALALAGVAGIAGTGWQTSISPSMSGAPGGPVT